MNNQLEHYARRLLVDALNEEVSPHTRYTVACRALAALCDAGGGSSADRLTLSQWERRRYGDALVVPPRDDDIAAVVARVDELLEG